MKGIVQTYSALIFEGKKIVLLFFFRRSTLGVGTAGGRIYAVGGYDGNTGLCTSEAFDPRTGFPNYYP